MTSEGPIVAIDHVYYWTRDMDRAVAFYETVLGLAVSSRAGNEWAEFRAGPVRLALHGTEETSMPPSGTVVFRVEDLDEARWALQQRGVVFDGHESEVPGVARFTTFHDPDGNLLQLIEYRTSGASPGSSHD
jgi:catechol 2,3-dioxygenase-like lactoylglutathione lyase family enzyme